MDCIAARGEISVHVRKHIGSEGKVKSVEPDCLEPSTLICIVSVHTVHFSCVAKSSSIYTLVVPIFFRLIDDRLNRSSIKTIFPTPNGTVLCKQTKKKALQYMCLLYTCMSVIDAVRIFI